MFDYQNEPLHNVMMIDSKSFYASVECVKKGLNPLRAALVVVSQEENTGGGGLVLAASPMAKKLFDISNVSRFKDLPNDPRLIKVPPRMNLYIEKNLEINAIYRRYVASEDLHAYSIDESMLDLTKSWRLFGRSPEEVARKIQLDVRREVGVYTTVGLGDNPLLAKLAMDIAAKHNHALMATWHYQNVPDTIWRVQTLTDIWGIGQHLADRLAKLDIHTMYQLAHTDPYLLEKKLGIIGAQLFATAWGIDRSIIAQKYQPVSRSYGNSQVLPRNYSKPDEIEIVLREIAEQVAARIRKRHLQTGLVSLSLGLAQREATGRHFFSHQAKITPTNLNHDLSQTVIGLFRAHWHGQAIRNIGISYGNLISDQSQQLNFFETPHSQIQRRQQDFVVDSLRQRYGFKTVVKASSLLTGGTAIQRTGLVGGHNGGNSYE
ncbi:Y-family DNA polymerase [Lapidilactobacillus gannanensis]|uniref:Y-family DNA polymerase n=1 Tax=Lapidilactobacillus gannanensis TaxID=2486002 RepID=A0ABW4BMS2_9LACO|nr:Y-family DNA polymerase [Lapidilactobacillus gannanensis]MCH4057103.1 Y-family DNA polymerase [Lactobacillaceae bacterium]